MNINKDQNQDLEFENLKKYSLETINKDENLNLTSIKLTVIQTISGEKLLLIQKEEGKGLYILDPISKVFLEKVPDAQVVINNKNQVIYSGLLGYYVKENEETYKHVISNDIINKDSLIKQTSTFSSLLSKIRIYYEDGKPKFQSKSARFSNTSPNLVKVGNKYYIKDYEIIKNLDKFPENRDGVCCYTASTILLYYWHKRVGGIIPDKFLDSDGTLKTQGYTLQDELLKIGRSMGYGKDSWAAPQRYILSKYLKDNTNKEFYTRYYLLKTYLWGEIDRGRPALGFGNFYKEPPRSDEELDGNYGAGCLHGVVIYGYTDNYYISHYGWAGYNHAYLIDATFGSVAFVDIKDDQK
ncbi:hypothetical protein [Mycoplasma hafezii]|uniref:hypothetical protein n=1 Tax=Mycoplasma hafezii TaxID=525886 RepID=UPI003CF1FFF9